MPCVGVVSLIKKQQELLELVERKGDKKHVKMLWQIKGHDHVESLQIMLEVIEVLEKNLRMMIELNVSIGVPYLHGLNNIMLN